MTVASITLERNDFQIPYSVRRQTRQQILSLLQKNQYNAMPKLNQMAQLRWAQSIPKVVAHIDHYLVQSATSLAVYQDSSTLHQRVRTIALHKYTTTTQPHRKGTSMDTQFSDLSLKSSLFRKRSRNDMVVDNTPPVIIERSYKRRTKPKEPPTETLVRANGILPMSILCTPNEGLPNEKDRLTLSIDFTELGEMMLGQRPIAPGFTVLENLYITSNQKSCSNESLDLSNMLNILRLFIDFLTSGGCKSVKNLHLHGIFNSFCGAGVQMICSALQDNVCPNLTTLSLQNNYLNDTGAHIIAAMLASKTFRLLEKMDLQQNNISDSGINAIAWALSVHSVPELTEMDLSHNAISDKGCLALGAAFRTNCVDKLHSLSIQKNNIQQVGALCLLKCKKNGFLPQLKTLNMDAAVCMSLQPNNNNV